MLKISDSSVGTQKQIGFQTIKQPQGIVAARFGLSPVAWGKSSLSFITQMRDYLAMTLRPR